MISLSFSTIFDINSRSFKVRDTTNYSSQAINLSDVTGVIKITTPRGVTHVNTNYSSPDINQSVSLDSAYFLLPLNAQGYILAGAYSIDYSVKRISTSEVSIVTNNYTYSFIVPAVDILQMVDGYNSTFTSTDNTNYGSYASITRSHIVTPPSGSPLSVTSNSNQIISYSPDIWSGIWTTQISSVLVYNESDGLIINANLTSTKTVTAYLNDMNVIRGYIQSFELLYQQARATDKNLAYRYQLSLEKINTSYVGYDLALFFNDLATAYARTVDIVTELSDYITITFPAEIHPFVNNQGGSGHNPVSIGGAPFGVSISTNQVISFSLASTISGGMLKQLSGSATDYLGGDGNWHSLTSGTYALKSDFTSYDAVRAITATNITNWNTAFGWGNHASAGYAIATNYYTKTNLQTSGQALVHWNNVTNHPTTVSGYGISDAMSANTAITGATHTKITYDTKGLVTGGSDLIASDIPSLAWSKITSGLPTTVSGYGISDAYTKTEVNNKTWDWSSIISGKPTTLSGYGISDSYTSAQVDAKTWDFTTAITGKPTTLSGYGITNALSTTSPAAYVINSGVGTLFLADDATYKPIKLSGISTTQVVYIDSTTPSGSAGFTFDKVNVRLSSTQVLTSNLYVSNTSTGLSKDGSNHLVFTDAVSGSVTLASLISGATNFWSSVSGGISYVNRVGVNNPGSLYEALTVNGNIQATNFNSSYFRYTSNNLLLGPNAGDLETGNNLLYIANTNTTTPLILGDFLSKSLIFNADTYINSVKRLGFGDSSVNIRRDSLGNLVFVDLNANSGSPILLSDLMIGSLSGYALKADFLSYTSVESISDANLTTWNKASHIVVGGAGTNFLGDDGNYHPGGGGGVTPTDGVFKFDLGSVKYRPYTDKTEAGGGSSSGKFYLGTTNPTATVRLNYDGYLYATKVFSNGSELVNTFRITVQAYNTDILGAGGAIFTTIDADIYNPLSHTLTYFWTGPSGYISTTKTDASITNAGIYVLQVTDTVTGLVYESSTNVYELFSVEPGLGNPPYDNYILSSLADGTRSWVPQGADGIFHWDAGTFTYTPYGAQVNGAFYNAGDTPVHTSASLSYDGVLNATRINGGNTSISSTSISGFTGGGTAMYGSAQGGDGVVGNSVSGKGGWFSSYTGNALVVTNQASSASSSPMVNISRYSSGSNSQTGDIMLIVDNPSTSGIISGSILKAYVGSNILMDYNPRVTDGASTVAYMEDTFIPLTNASAKLHSFRNFLTEKAAIFANGAIMNDGSNKWIFKGVTSSYSLIIDSTKYITVNIGGVDYKLALAYP